MYASARTTTRLFIALVCGAPLMAQTLETGALMGTVRDETGKPLAGAQVIATSGQTTRTATSDTQGRYRLNLLGLGRWNLKVVAGGRQTVTAQTKLGINQVETINYKLLPIARATVEVEARAEALDHTSTQVVSSFQSETLTTLPGDYASLNALDAIVTTVPGVQSTGGNAFQFFGGTHDQNLFVVDGNSTNATKGNTAQNRMNGLPPREFMESIEVVTGGFGAEYNVLGGVINMATRSGSNTWTGEAFWYTNFPNASARNHTGNGAGQRIETPPTTNTRFGATVGGPLLKDRLFFFLGLQGSKTWAPSTGSSGPNWSGYTSSPYTQKGPNTLSAKVNWIVNPDHELILATTNVRMDYDFGNAYPSDASMSTGPGNSGSHGYTSNQTTNLTWNWTLNSRMYLVTSVGNRTDPTHRFTNAPMVDGAIEGFMDYRYFLEGPGAAAPNKPQGYENYGYIGGNIGYANSQSNPNRQFRMDFTWTPANHTIKAGYSLQNSRYDNTASRVKGWAIFSPYINYGYTGDPADLELYTSEGDAVSQKGTYAGYYVKDLWEVAPGLRVDLGLRFDSIRFVGNNPPIAGQQLLNFSRLGRQIQPRVGIAWDVNRDGRTKLYANYGRFFQTMPLSSFAWASATAITCEYWRADQWTYNRNYTGDQAPFALGIDPATGKAYEPYAVYNIGSLTTNPPMANDLRLPHKDMVLVGIDRALPGGWTVGASWRWWTLKDPIVTSMFTNPDGTSAFPEQGAAGVVWNPGPGPVNFTTGDGQTRTWDSKFPDPKEVFIALNLNAQVTGRLGYLSANYTWTHHYGNYRGLNMAMTTQLASQGTWGGNANATSDWYYYQTINSGNNEANPVHELKLNGALKVPLGPHKLEIGAAFGWQSGYGLTSLVPIVNKLPGAYTNGSTVTSSNLIMSNYGQTPSMMNLDLNLTMTMAVGPLQVTPSLAITNLFNKRAVTTYHMTKEYPSYGNTPVPDPYFGRPLAWQQGRTLTGGVSVKF